MPSYSAALPLANLLVRTLIVLNWLVGAAIIILLVAMPTERWITTALGLTPSPQSDRLISGLHLVAGIGLAVVPLNYVVLKRILGILGTVRSGNPFVSANARHLHVIAWAMLGLQLISLAIGWIAVVISTPSYPVDFDAGFSIPGWLAVFLAFVLARVFAEGSLLREEIEGTV